MDWDYIRDFLAIARTRSLSAAARELGVRQSTMSRRLQAIEAQAGARLLQKLPTGYELTPLGEAVYNNAERMESEAISVKRIVQGRDVALSGVVRLTTVEMIANNLLPSVVSALHKKYPNISVDVLSETRSLSLSRREADIAIRMARFEGNNLVARKVAMAASAMYASSAYLAAHGSIPSDHNHAVITVMDDQAHLPEPLWLMSVLPQARLALRSNNRDAQLGAVRAGVGVACLPCYLADGVPDLVRINEAGFGPEREVWLGVHADLRYMPRIRALIDLLDAEFAIQKHRFLGEIVSSK